MVVLCILCIAQMVPIGVLFKKIKNIDNEDVNTEMSQFESSQSKKALKLEQEPASEEAAIKREESASKNVDWNYYLNT